MVRGLRKSCVATSREVGGPQLTGGTVRERLRAHVQQQPMRGAELFPGVMPAPLAAKPLPVDKVGAGQVGAHAAAPELVKRLSVLLLSLRPGAGQCTRTRR